MTHDLSNPRRHGTSRRTFIGTLSMAGVGAMAGGCCTQSSRAQSKPTVAFVTANLVARVTQYRYELKNWGEQHKLTVAQTDERAWAGICADISRAGFRAVEVWEAHAAPESMNAQKAALWKRILDDHGLRPVAYAGGLRRETLDICQWLGIPHIDGGLRVTPAEGTKLCEQYRIGFNYENHPEKNAREILAKIEGGNQWLGVCVDTGWLGTQGASTTEVIRQCGSLVRHVHIKDVLHAGAHETCLLGEGVVDLEGTFKALDEIGYKGAYSWEDEPEDRNPFDSAQRNRKWIEARV